MNVSLKNSLWAIAFFTVAIAWIYGLTVDLTGDSGLYAAISRQMVESGDWLNLKINGMPYDQKPHLFFWLAGMGIELFGNSNFAYKFFLFFAGLSGVYFTYRLGRLLYSEAAGQLAALFTGTSQLYFLYFFDIHTDTVLQSAVVLSLWQLASFLKNRRTVNFVLAFFAIGLGMLTKGPVGAVLPFFFVLFTLLLKKQYRQLLHPRWLAGIGLVFLVISPALYHLWLNFGAEGLRFYFIDNNIGRVTGELTGTSTDPFFYLYNMLWAFLPWTIPVLAGLLIEVKTWFRRSDINIYTASLLGGIMVVFFVFSIARGKAPNYLMMLMPPMAAVAAGRVLSFLKGSAKGIKLLAWVHISFIIVITILPVAILLFIIPGLHYGWLSVFAVVFAVIASLFFYCERLFFRRIVFISTLAIAAFNLYLNTMVLPELFKYQGARQVFEIYEKEKLSKEALYVFEIEEYEAFFYSNEIHALKSWENLFDVLEVSGTWVYTNEIKYNDLVNLGYDFDQIHKIEQRGMNEISMNFLLHTKRKHSLTTNYLVKVK